MPQFTKLLSSLSWKQRISIVAAAVLMVVGLLTFTRWRHEGDFKPLFTNLSAEDAASMIQKLKESGTEYRVSDNGATISAPAARVAELRLDLAAAGLPHTGRIGYELFDQTNFGATEFVEHINYRRALEGELERSVMSLAEVERARVHITFPKDSVYVESRQPAKASVMVKLKPGAHLSPQNVLAIAKLVGSAVEGLSPESVSILDMQGNLLSRNPKGADEEASESMLNFRRKLEKDLLAKIETTLEPLLGPDRFRAGVSVECDFTSGEQSDETYDPSKSVMASSEKSEESGTPSQTAGVPGTPSNLPRPVARSTTSLSSYQRRSENVAFQNSRSIRKIKIPQGTVKRVSISVLLDQDSRWEKQGKDMKLVLQPPSPETLKSVRDIVAGIAGFDQQRGDQIMVESLPFENTRHQQRPELPPAATPAPGAKQPTDVLKLIKANPKPFAIGGGALLAVLLALGFFVVWSRKKKTAAAKAVELKNQAALPSGAEAPAGIDAAEEGKTELEKLADRAAEQAELEAKVLNSIQAGPVKTQKTEVLVKEIRENLTKDATTAAQVLRTLMQQEEYY
jgi:flagellar M-ring protein FliF